ncbi:MAG: ABC transporter permease [Armatimonadetes bacterium]|nr:ABC transporter permease [Armatimonadota bacterium]
MADGAGTAKPRRPRRPARGNPLFAREFSAPCRWLRRLRSSTWRRVLMLLVVGLSYDALVGLLAWAMLVGDFTPDPEVVIVLALAAVCLLVPGTTAPAIAGERQRGSWDMLRVTRLRTGQLVGGKLAGRVGYLLAFAALALPLVVVMVAGDLEFKRADGLATLLVGLPTVFGLGALGLYCSARCRTVGSALGTAYAVAAGLVLLIPVGEALWQDLSQNYSNDPSVCLVTSPPMAWVAVASQLKGNHEFGDNSWLGFCCPAFYLLLGIVGVLLTRDCVDGETGARPGRWRPAGAAPQPKRKEQGDHAGSGEPDQGVPQRPRGGRAEPASERG